MYFVLMAGGSGTRLWPMSRQNSPKQFQDLVQPGRSLLQQTYDLLTPLAPPERIFVCTLERYQAPIQGQLPDIPPTNYFLEPVARNTGPATGLIATYFARTEPEAVVATLSTDLLVTRPEAFARALRAGEEALAQHPEALVTIGLPPTWPDPHLGYIRVGPSLGTIAGEEVFQVRQFVEKPDPETAQQYLASGEYLWNSSYFVWPAGPMLRLFERFLPATARRLRTIQEAWGTESEKAVLEREYQVLESIAFDVGILQQADRVLVIPADLGWWEVGNWANLYEALCALHQQDVVVRGRYLGQGNRNCLIYGQEKLIATLGLENLIVVETPDVILVCRKDRAPEVKGLLERLREEGWEQYL